MSYMAVRREEAPSFGRLELDERFEVESVLAEREAFSRYVVQDTQNGARRLLEIHRVSPAEEASWSSRASLARRLHHPSLLRCLESHLVTHRQGVLVFEEPPDGTPCGLFDFEGTARTAVSVASVLALLHRAGLLFGTPIVEPAFWEKTRFGLRIRVDVLSRAIAGHRREPLCAHALLYAPPEIAAGEPPTPASDLYVLGTLLYRMLTGSPPPVSGVEPHPHAPSRLRSGLPQDDPLAEEVLRLLEQEPSRRPSSASQVCGTFLRWLLAKRRNAEESPSFGWIAASGSERTYVIPTLSAAAVRRLREQSESPADFEHRVMDSLWRVAPSRARDRAPLDRVQRLKAAGSIEAALRAMEAARAKDPLLHATLLWRAGRSWEADALLSRDASDALPLRAILAREQGDLERARDLLRDAPGSALALTERGHLERGEAALGLYRTAITASVDPREEAQARSSLGRALARTGRLRAAADEMALALDLLVDGEDDLALDPLRVFAAEVDLQLGHWDRARPALVSAADRARRRGDAWLLQIALAPLAEIELLSGDQAAGREHIAEHVKLAAARRDPASRLTGLWLSMEERALSDDFEGALARMRAHRREAGFPRENAFVLLSAARAALALGQARRAGSYLVEARACIEPLGDPTLTALFQVVEALLVARNRDWERAGLLFESAIRSVEDRSLPLAQARAYIDFVNIDWPDADSQLVRSRRRGALALVRDLGAKTLFERLDDVDERTAAPAQEFPGIRAESAAMRSVLKQVGRAAPFNVAVHLTGESGTGKELLARALHARSPRARAVFVAINCAALPDSLLEAELFGHARGAFTGAERPRAGLLEEAQGGTLFLDEIADLSPRGQTLLLRVLQEKEYRRLGETTARRSDVRVISASHKCLEDEVRAGRFREDLLFRLKVVSIRIPPLRERVEDILPIAHHVLEGRVSELGLAPTTLDAEAEKALVRHSWPGNVRELENEITQALLRVGSRRILGVEHLSSHLTRASTTALRAASRVLEKRLLEQALDRHGGNRSRAARELGLSRQALYGKLRKHQLSREAPSM